MADYRNLSDRSLVSTYNSHQHGRADSADPENIWSLTNRIHHDGMGKARNPEYAVIHRPCL